MFCAESLIHAVAYKIYSNISSTDNVIIGDGISLIGCVGFVGLGLVSIFVGPSQVKKSLAFLLM